MTSRFGLVAASILTTLVACSSEEFAPPPAGAVPIAAAGGEGRVRYYRLETARSPDGLVQAIVLQQFPNGRPGTRFGYEIECGAGPRYRAIEAESLAALRAAPRGDRNLVANGSDTTGQVVVWLCG